MTSRELTFLIVLKPHGEVTIFTFLKASLGEMSALLFCYLLFFGVDIFVQMGCRKSQSLM